MTGHAHGTFDVKLAPQPTADKDDSGLKRFSLDKQFHGDLEGSSKGEMLSASSSKESGAYVAIEIVTGALQGRKGGFVLQHSGTMDRGAQQLNISVVPGSGTDQLTGLAGKIMIKIEDGKHFYDFDYTLPDRP